MGTFPGHEWSKCPFYPGWGHPSPGRKERINNHVLLALNFSGLISLSRCALDGRATILVETLLLFHRFIYGVLFVIFYASLFSVLRLVWDNRAAGSSEISPCMQRHCARNDFQVLFLPAFPPLFLSSGPHLFVLLAPTLTVTASHQSKNPLVCC